MKLYILMAALACWRLTGIVAEDGIFDGIRTRWPHYFWTCFRCVSVWAAAVCALIFIYVPQLNVPLGLSALAILIQWAMRIIDGKKKAGTLSIKEEKGNLRIDLGGLPPVEAETMLRRALEGLQHKARS